MLRRLYHTQPENFAFSAANLAWAEAQLTKYPEGRQASAVIALLWRAQEQEGWLSRPAMEHVAGMLGMDYIRVLEVATFYFMFQLQPVGSVAHFQICGTLSCMITGSEDLMQICKNKINQHPHQLSDDGRFSWEEVECLGACSNAPMAQIGKDFYEDLTPESFIAILDQLADGATPVPGPQNGRYSCEPLDGLTSLTEYDSGRTQYNASAQRAHDVGDGIKRIDGSEVPLSTPWLDKGAKTGAKKPKAKAAQKKPRALKAARKAGADDLKLIKGVGPKLEALLNTLGFFHFDQIAAWKADEIAWVDENLQGFKGRAGRDDWVAQAKTLAAGGQTEFSQKAGQKAGPKAGKSGVL